MGKCGLGVADRICDTQATSNSSMEKEPIR
jgi:hypothetical protein